MRVLKEPLFHFVLIGIAIFGWFYLVAPDDEVQNSSESITIDETDVELLATRFETSWRRTPSDEELQALIEAMVREEVLVREARKLGLDRGDPVIRARLSQKMEFLSDAIASSVEPENAVLQAYFSENAERFKKPRQVAFEQVFLGESADQNSIDKAISTLRSGSNWTEVGVQSLLPGSLPLTTAKAIDSVFGAGFSSKFEDAESGVWFGPVQSGYGVHLIRVVENKPEELPPLDEVRASVLQEWRRATANELAQAQYETLSGQYEVSLPELSQGEK